MQYGELSEIFRAWAGLDSSRLEGEAVVCNDLVNTANYEAILERAFSEMRRALKPDGHLVLSYANRESTAWAALFGALQAAGFTTVGYQVVHAENDTSHAKVNRRACNLDVILDLVVMDGRTVKRFAPRTAPKGPEDDFCRMLGRFALRIGRLDGAWREELQRCVSAHPFVERNLPNRDARRSDSNSVPSW
ncbi:hypothetical protein MELE44368_14300 [Mycolicibacterium elephantis DSM 44368]|uniref:Uncharacterized protein n=1 Tax=Mycolicibacterium elephantis DSM 44368 TaxID=1335622 RepID=A0A439DWZ0_9MYCO|nr:hypothetical protein MELE44368_14300 [Mycolicibacterium elephantis DSM 44368]